jgi:hypothetical protein
MSREMITMRAMAATPVMRSSVLPVQVRRLFRNRDPKDVIRVWDVVPAEYEAYFRILHPVKVPIEQDQFRTWKAIADRSGVLLAGTLPFRRITVPPGSPVPPGPTGAWGQDDGPWDGSLPHELAERLADTLNAADDCWMAVWEGRVTKPIPEQLSVRLFGNPHVVYRGNVGESILDGDFEGGLPNLWFPADLSWCVGTLIDAHDTYVGASAQIHERLLESGELEVLSVSPQDVVVERADWLKP